MKALLICPSDRPAVPHLAERGPLATLPVLGDCLVNHWVEHLATQGARHIDIIAPKCAEAIREAVGDGARWGVSVNVIATNIELTRDEAAKEYKTEPSSDWLPHPLDIVTMSFLPGHPELPLFESYASWFAAVAAWMPRAITPTRIRMAELRPGIWVGRRAHVSPKAELIAPCWIGDHVIVEQGAVIGPDTVLEDRTVVDEKARVIRSWVGPDTFVGPMTCVATSLAWGSTLINWQSDSSLRVMDPFLLGSLSKNRSSTENQRPDRAVVTRHQTSSLGFFAALRARLSGG